MTTVRTAPELRDEAKRRIARRLSHEATLERPTPPDLLAAELLVLLDSAQIHLKDGRTHTPVTGRPVDELPPDNPYRAARAAYDATRQAQKDQP